MEDERYVDFDEMPEPVSVRGEFARIQLTELGRTLINKGVACNLIDDDEDGYVLLVPIDGPKNMNLALSLLLDENDNMTLTALYRSDILGETIFESMELPTVPDYNDVAENFVIDLAEDIFLSEQENISKTTDINNKNAEEEK